jgi:serine/threonine protein kinase/tetratricopeptide (TPR) repeat protein
MDQQRWEIIREVFDAALELPSSEREAFIRGASQQDAEVYAELKNLLHADEEASEFLESPLLAAGAFQQFSVTELPLLPGEVLCQRFRILRAVGEGGMGYVFEAWDMELRRSVALKAIRPEVAGHSESLKRFRQEVSLALRITHPNVCRTFDIERETRVVDTTTGRSREIVFLTMEFLQGETLAERLSRTGPLPLDHALHIARQIADALTCAHQLGIYHRDIKPANVMLVPATLSQASPSSSEFPRTVITDFGLARQEAILRSDGLSGVSSSGIPLGTFAYMAPEQLECAETSAATDIYAFGLVLFEMVTGKRAFSSSNPLSGIKQRLTGPAPSPQSVIPGLPEIWCRAIEGCLRLNPAERPQNAADVMAILDGSKVSLPPRVEKFVSHAPSTRRFTLASWSIRLRVFAMAMILVAIVSLSLAGLRLYQSKANSKVTPGALVYLTPVKNQTGEKAFDNLTELIQAGLTQSAQINLLDQGRVGDILQQMTKSPDTVITEPIAREIAMRAGAPRVVFATVTGTNGSYKLNIDIQQPDATGIFRIRKDRTKSFPWHTSGSTTASGTIPAELLTAVRDTSDWIRHEAGESQNDIARLDAPPEDVTTDNWDALSLFDKAIRLQSDQKTEEATLSLKKALEFDPHFALAYGRLGDLLVSLGRSDEGMQSYAHALDLTEIRRLTQRERDRIRGLAALDSGDYETSVAAFRDYAINYSDDYLGWFYLGYPLMMLGRTDESLTNLRKSYGLAPSRRDPAQQLATFDVAAGHYDEARQLAKVLAANNHGPDSTHILGLAAFLEANYPDAESAFQKLQQSSTPSDRSLGNMMLVRVAAEQGKLAQALEVVSIGIAEDRNRGSMTAEAQKLTDRAELERQVRSYAGMFKDIELALTLDRSYTRLNSSVMILGRSLTDRENSIADAIRSKLFSLDKQFAGEGTRHGEVTKLRLHAQVLLANGQWKNAIDTCRRASALDSPAADRAYLALTLIEASNHVVDPAQRRSLQDEAFANYSRTVFHPGLSWINPYDNLPGFYADEMANFLKLASQLGKNDPEVARIEETLTHLRKNASPALIKTSGASN